MRFLKRMWISCGKCFGKGGAFLKKGVRHVDSEWSMKWVQSRIVPSSRQNIGEILRVNKMATYDEHVLLLKNEGRSCQDEFYVEAM